MKITLTKEQLNTIWKNLTPNAIIELMSLIPNASIEVIAKFIYLYARQPWQKKLIQEALNSAPTEIELFPDETNP